MSGNIYLDRGDDKPIEMKPGGFETEEQLQALLAKVPGLMGGDQMNPNAPRRWLLISREAGVPDRMEGADRWSVDHLFLDQEGIPTLVEVKRSSNTELRRQVVGQMLDYAANALAYWSVDTIRAKFEDQQRRILESEVIQDKSEVTQDKIDQALLDFLGAEADPEQFWESVKTNLQAGKLRLVFVADEIPDELRRIVEFLSLQMDRAEVLAVEIKQYAGEGFRTLVPRVLGQRPPPPPRPPWDWETFKNELRRRSGDSGDQDVGVAKELLDWATRNRLRIRWGKGQQDGSFSPTLALPRGSYSPIAVWTSGGVQVQFAILQSVPPFVEEATRLALRDKLNQIPGISIPPDAITKYPNIRFSLLRDQKALSQLLNILDSVVQEAKTQP